MFGFLKNATVEEVQKNAVGGGGQRKQRNPLETLLAIRIFFNGSIFPSEALVQKFALNYVKPSGKDDKKGYVYLDGNSGNGFDVIDSENWAQFKAEGKMLFIAPVKRSEPKVDLFGSVGFDAETMEPQNNVMDQGSTTYGEKTLLPMLAEVYGIVLAKKTEQAPEAKEYADMLVTETVEGFNVKDAFQKPFYNFPKTIASGKDKGKATYVRRENTSVYAFIPYTGEATGNDLLQDQPTSQDFDLDSAPVGSRVAPEVVEA